VDGPTALELSDAHVFLSHDARADHVESIPWFLDLQKIPVSVREVVELRVFRENVASKFLAFWRHEALPPIDK